MDLSCAQDGEMQTRYANITKVCYVAARIRNLLNKDYETAYSYTSLRRGAYLTVGWQQ
ncbi:hypothetical protein [Paraburkholderia agricolaris]|uniref:hypothetical protein n=1 Tax=Paraburkholderia agricolaris TaxID=2152888 RepID=UPI00129224BC|nr:hypothetical protein [Paraburkholderia agricolaris]